MKSEFDNVWGDYDDTRDHLYKVQLARCGEFLIYIRQLNKKYNQKGIAWWDGWDNLVSNPHETVKRGFDWVENRFKVSTEMLSGPKNMWIDDRTLITSEEKQKYLTKLRRILAAKTDFELFGGEYKKYQ